MRLFNNPKAVTVAVLLFVGLLILLWSRHSRASDLILEGGSAMLRGETPTLGVNLRWPSAGPVNTDYELGFNLVGESDHYRQNSNVIIVHALLVDGWRAFEAGLGFYGQNVAQEYNCQFGFQLMARWRFSQRLAAQWRHFSSAGSCLPNAGRDLLTLGWRF